MNWSVFVVAVQTMASGGLVDRRHGVFERATSREVFAAANTALDLLVLELILDTSLLTDFLCLLGLRLPVHTWSEDDVLADGGGVERRTRSMALLETELRPCPPLCDLRVYVLLHNSGSDPTGDLDLLAFIVEAVGNDGLCAIFVGGDLLRGEAGGVIELLVVGPVGTAKMRNFVRNNILTHMRERGKILTLPVSTSWMIWRSLERC